MLLPRDLDEHVIIEQWLRSKRGARVTLHIPKRGPKKDLVDMASENARTALVALQAEWEADAHRHTEAIANLQIALDSQERLPPLQGALRHSDRPAR